MKLTLQQVRLRHDNHTSPTQAEREFLLDQIRSYELNLGLSMKKVEELEARLKVSTIHGKWVSAMERIEELEAKYKVSLEFSARRVHEIKELENKLAESEKNKRILMLETAQVRKNNAANLDWIAELETQLDEIKLIAEAMPKDKAILKVINGEKS